jgi:hypothetical protein
MGRKVQLPGRVRGANGADVASSPPVAVAPGHKSARLFRPGLLVRLLPHRFSAVLFLLAASLATVALWFVSHGKWGDAIVDSGREWIVPDSLARGDLLYRDVVYWFGPLTPYMHALLFRLFGSGFPTLVLAGILASLAVLASLYTALRQVTGRVEAMLGTSLTIPALLFMPSAGGAILGMGYRIWHAAVFTLFAVSIAVRPFRWRRAVAAGSFCALAFLCRTEWGLAAMGGVAIAAAVRDRFQITFLRDVLAAGLAFTLLGGGVLAVFIKLAGASAVLRDGHVLLTGLPWETRRFLLNVSGFRDPLGGFLRLLYSAAFWAGFFLLVDAAATWKEDRERLRRRLPWLAGIAVILIVYFQYRGSFRMVLMSAAPAIGLGAVFFSLKRGSGPRAAALAAFGSLAVVLFYRKLFSIEDFPYVAPPLLFAVISGLGILSELVASERLRAPRERLRLTLRLALAVLVFASFADRIIAYAADDRVTLPGTGGMLSADEGTVRTLGLLSKTIRERTSEQDGLVVLPEGEVLNAMTGRINPLRHKLYLPGYLTDDNEMEILSEIRRAMPAAIVIIHRSNGMYGRAFFGLDYGKKILAWIEENYFFYPLDSTKQDRRPDSGDRLFLRRATVERP